MNFTQVTTVDAILTLPVQDDSSSIKKANFQSYYDQLLKITEKHEQWNDPLSNKLLNWIVEVLSLDITQDGEFEEKLQSEAVKRIGILFQDILINPLDQEATLEEPYLEGDWVWEKWMLEDYQKNFPGVSLFYGKKSIEIIPHTFAKEMLIWARSIPLDPKLTQELCLLNRNEISLISKVTTIRSQALLIKYLFYATQAKNALKIHTERSLRETAERELQQMRQWKIEEEKVYNQEMARLEQIGLDTQKMVKEEIQEIKQTFGEQIEILQFRNEENGKEIKYVNGKLQESKAECTNLEQNLRNVQSQNYQLRQQIDDLYNRSGKKGCSIL